MTVIAYRDGILAADKLSQMGGMKARVTKIYQVGDAMVGIAGVYTLGLELLEWIRSGADAETVPDFQKTQEDYQQAILIRNREIWLYEQGCTPFRIEGDYFAIGSGSPYAMSAMWCGKTAEQGVQCASELSTGCGLGVDVLRDSGGQDPAATVKLRLVA